MSLPKQSRLKRPQDFSWVYRQGKKAVSRDLVVRSAPRQTSTISQLADSPLESQPAVCLSLPTQFGISISQKVSKRAVVRNLLKRRIKAAIRTLLPEVKPDLQVVIVVRPSAVRCEYGEFLRQLNCLLKKLEVLNGYS